MVINEIKDAETLVEEFGDVEQGIVSYIAAVQLQMDQSWIGSKEFDKHGFIDFCKVVLQNLYTFTR
jgi:hypothetical protein